MFFLGLVQAQFAPRLLADVEEAGIIEVLLPCDPDEAGHHGGFRFLVCRYEIRPFRPVVFQRSPPPGRPDDLGFPFRPFCETLYLYHLLSENVQ